MGNQQSSEKPSEKPTSSSRHGTSQSDREKKIGRRVSIPVLSQGRSTPVDPSATRDTAVAQTISQHLSEKPQLQQYLQAASPEQHAKSTRVERSSSRAKREEKGKERSVPIPLASGPMDVPVAKSKQDSVEEQFAGQSNYQDRRFTPVAQTRPPRLPLPIADVPIPESPALLPVDKGNNDVPIFETDEPLPDAPPEARRKSSMLSQTTMSEEDVNDELQPYAVEAPGSTVPTVIEWNSGGNKVYVTGTFANWEKKYRLHQRKSSPGMYTTINLAPGTHHLKFVVDGEMVTSPELPTAVDFNNFLVNYIEIATEDLSKQRRESSHQPREGAEDATESGQQTPSYSDEDSLSVEEIQVGDFRQIIPQALVDIDLPDDDPHYHSAAWLIHKIAHPPVLPMFMSKSILNGNLPVKDDNSVLTLPNHTVLNHLMTSSVKNGVLATSVTTRYKKKYVTTISFKPVPKFNQNEKTSETQEKA